MSDDLSRNFRSYYYGKVGCRGVEEKKSLETLLSENPMDIVKISQFCTRFPVPAMYRTHLWKVMLGIESKVDLSRQFVEEQRREQCDLLKHGLKIMSKIRPRMTRGQLFMYMYLLEEGCIYSDIAFNEKQKHLLAISNASAEMFEDDCDAYWVTRNFYNLIQSQKTELIAQIDRIPVVIQKEDTELQKHVDAMFSLLRPAFLTWCFCGFGGILPDSCLERLWDKVIAGSISILPFVLISMLITHKKKLLHIYNPQDIPYRLFEAYPESSEMIVCQALELWQKHRLVILEEKLKI